MKRIGLFISAVLVVLGAAGILGCSSDEDVANYQGTLSGSWQGSGMNGSFTVTIDADGIVAGRYSGSDSGTITGTVDKSGSFSASAAGQAGVANWTGDVKSSYGHVSSGSGTWTAPGRSGTWNAP
jgi:hypothetical protein